MKFYLMRHGEYVVNEASIEGALTETGKQTIHRLGAFLENAHLQVAEIWHSTRLRAKQTAEIMAQYLGNPPLIQQSGLEPHDSASAFAKAYSHLQESILVVGHLPFMSRLASEWLLANEDKEIFIFNPGTLLCLEQIDPERFNVSWMLSPDLFPRPPSRGS